MVKSQLMTLKDLKGSLDRHIHESSNIDSSVACNIIDIMFGEVSRCIQQDRSRIKINVLTKGVVLGLLGDRTKGGMKEYLVNMYPKDINSMLDSIQKELDKRKIK